MNRDGWFWAAKLRRWAKSLSLLGLVVLCAGVSAAAHAQTDRGADQQINEVVRGPAPDLTVTITDAPDPVAVSQNVDYDINLANVGTGSANMVDVAVFYSGALTPVALPTPGWTCLTSTIITCSLSAGSISAPGTAPLLRLRFAAPAMAQTVQVTVSASSLEPDSNPANNTNITQTTLVANSDADLNMVLSSSATSVEVGTPISFTANVSNAGPGAAPALQVSGTLSGAVVFSNFSVSTSWNCTHSGGAISCTYQGGAPSGTLASGLNAASITINGVAGPGTGSANLGLTATSAANDPTPATANSAIAVTAASPGSVDLSLSKVVVGAQPIPRNMPFAYRLIVSNAANSTQTGSGIQISDTLPAGIVLQGFSGAGWSCSGNVICTYAPTLAAGQSSAPLDLQVVYDSAVPAGGTSVSNTATVSSADPDPDPANNQASASASIRGNSDLAVQLNAASPVVAGSSFTLDLVANNLGPDVASNVTATATIAPGFGVGVVSGGAGWSCLASGQSVSCQRATMPTGSSTAASLTLSAPGTAGGPFNQQGSVSSDNFDAVTSNNLVSLPITVVAAVATLNLTKTDSADPVPLGTTFDYLLTVSNTGNVSQNALNIIDTLPADLSYLSFVGAGWNCTASTSVPVVVNCTNPGPLAAGASASVSLRVRGDAVGSVTNTAQVSSQQNSTGASASQATTITQSQSLSFSKEARESSVALGQSALFDLTVSNSGPSEALGLVMLDDLPPGLDFQSASGDGWTCTFNAGRVDCRRPALAAGVNSTIVLETLPASAGNFVNRAQLQALGLAPLLSNDSVTVTNTPPPGGADLALEISDSADPATAGTRFEYLIRVRNLGPGVATDIRVVNSPSLNLAVLGSSSPGWACPLVGRPECTLAGPLAPGAESLLSLRVRADSAGTASNSATVSAAEADPVTANNSAQESTQIVSVQPNVADLSLSLAGPASAAAGDIVDLAAEVLNLGPSSADNVLVRARSNGDFTIQSGAGSGFACVPAGGGVDCRLNLLEAGASVALNLRAQIGSTASASVQALLDVNAAQTDTNPADNAAVAQITVTQTPPPPDAADLSISQTVSDDPLAFAQRFSYSVRVNNLGPAAAREVLISDILPVGTSLVSATGAGLVCTGTATIQCRASAALPSGQQLQLTVTVNAPNERATLSNEVLVASPTADPVASNNRSLLSTEVLPPEGTEAGESLMQTTQGDALAGDAVVPVVELCDGSTGRVSALCDALFQDAANGRNAEVRGALRALYPEEVLSQHASLNQLSNTQSFNLDARMSQLHNGGGAGVNLGGLNVINGTQPIPIALLQSLFQNSDEPEIGGPGDLISPWGFFVNGTISRGDQNVNGSNREVVLDFDSIGITAGVDYRRSARWVMGAAVGFDKFNSALTDDGKLETRALTLSGYSAYYLNDLTYLDTRLSYGRVNLDQTRRLRVNLTGFSLDETLSSDTQANQLTLATSLGHHFTRGAWTITPNGFVRYMRSTVDGFSERGSDFAVSYGDQTVSSLVFGAGIQVNRVISLSNGVLTPQFDLTWNHESRNNDTVIDASFVSGDPGEFFSLSPEEPDNSYGSVGIGLVYVLANGKQAYLQWRESVGVDGLSRSTVNLGARFEF